MVENYPIKIDESGRILIPAKVRNIHNIKEGTLLEISTCKNAISIKKHDDITKESLVEKLKKLECIYSEIAFLVSVNNKVYYQSKNLDRKTSYNYFEINSSNYTKIKLKIFYSDHNYKNIAKVLSKLLANNIKCGESL